MPGFLTSFFAALTMFFPGLMTRMTMFLTGEASNKLDVALVDEVMDIVVAVITKFVTLFTLWPLNLFLILGLIGLAIGLFFTAKRGVRR